MVVQVVPASGHQLSLLVLSPLPLVSPHDPSYQWQMVPLLSYSPHTPLSHLCEWEQFNTTSHKLHIHVYVTNVVALCMDVHIYVLMYFMEVIFAKVHVYIMIANCTWLH